MMKTEILCALVQPASSQQQLQSLVDRLQNPKPYNTFLLIKLCDHARPILNQHGWSGNGKLELTDWFRDCGLGTIQSKTRNVGYFCNSNKIEYWRSKLFWRGVDSTILSQNPSNINQILYKIVTARPFCVGNSDKCGFESFMLLKKILKCSINYW